MGGSSAGKVDICFYHYYPGAKQQKKKLVKGVFNWGKCPGAEVRICRSSRMGCTSAGKVDICFYHYYPGAKQQKKSSVKGFFGFFNCPGRKSGYLGWAAPVPEKLTSVFIITAQGRSSKKKRLVKGVFNWGKCPGAKVRICRSSRMGCTSAQGEGQNRSCSRAEQLPRGPGPEPGSSSPVSVNSCSLQVSFFPGLLCACWPALS